MTAALSTYSNISAIQANATLLMINRCVTMTMTTGLLRAVVLMKKEMIRKIIVTSGENNIIGGTQ